MCRDTRLDLRYFDDEPDDEASEPVSEILLDQRIITDGR